LRWKKVLSDEKFWLRVGCRLAQLKDNRERYILFSGKGRLQAEIMYAAAKTISSALNAVT
jgi:hypothetical protein